MANRILIVGGGLTGGLVQYFLSKAFINCNAPNIAFDLWEIAPSLGGRMKSYQFQKGHQSYDLDLVRQVL
jgi:protoporphyrinogen oxidase